MQKFSFYLVRFEIYRQKTKYGPILGLFSKSYNRGLRLIGWTYRIAIFRVDKASEVITFEQKKICKIWPPGGAASILIISVFARFDHVPVRFEGVSQAEMNNLHKIQLTKEKKILTGVARMVVNRILVKDIHFFHFSDGNCNTYQKTKDIFFLKWGMGKKSY